MNSIKSSAREDKSHSNHSDSSSVKPQSGFDEQLSSGTSNYLQQWKNGRAQICSMAENQKSISEYAVGVRKSSAALIF